jgi:hypothetical protein
MSDTPVTTTSYTPFIMAAAVGGLAMSAVSGAGTFVLEKKPPTSKAVARDFILGAVLLLLIMQLLPESTQKLIGYITALAAAPAAAIATAAATTASDAVAAVAAVAPSIASGELEVKVGVPRF